MEKRGKTENEVEAGQMGKETWLDSLYRRFRKSECSEDTDYMMLEMAGSDSQRRVW